MPVPAWRSIVQTEHPCLPELQLIMPADFDILPHCNPSGFGIAARTWPTGPGVSYVHPLQFQFSDRKEHRFCHI